MDDDDTYSGMKAWLRTNGLGRISIPAETGSGSRHAYLVGGAAAVRWTPLIDRSLRRRWRGTCILRVLEQVGTA